MEEIMRIRSLLTATTNLTFDRFVAPEAFTNPEDYATYGHQINIYSIFKSYLAYNPQAKAIYTTSQNSSYNTTIKLVYSAGRSYYIGQEVSGTMVYTTVTPVADFTYTFTSGSTKRHIIVNDTNLKVSIDFQREVEWLYFGENVTGLTRGNSSNYSQIKHIHCTNATNITTIAASLFAACIYLAGSINLTNSVTSIGSSAFSNCTSITGKLKIPYSLTSIGNAALLSTPITSIEVDSASNYFYTDGNGLYSKNSTTLYLLRNTYLGSYTLRSACQTIDVDACRGVLGLTSVVFPSGLKTLSTRAFLGNSGLTSIDLPSTVTSIANGSAFQGCANITTYYARMTTPTTYSGMQTSQQASITLHVPAASRSLYVASADWGLFGTIIGDL